jgi:hypothetical protein
MGRVKALRKNRVYQRNDERILGDGDFVKRMLVSAEEVVEKRYALKPAGFLVLLLVRPPPPRSVSDKTKKKADNETFRARCKGLFSINVGTTILCESKAQDS